MRLLPILAALAAGCAAADPPPTLEMRLARMEADMEAERHAARLEARTAAIQEEAARKRLPEEDQLLLEMRELGEKGDYEGARKKQGELRDTLGQRNPALFWRLVQTEIGMRAPAELEVERWIQGGEGVHLDAALATVVFFWRKGDHHDEEWLPELQPIYDAHKDRGLQVVGLVTLNPDAAEESVGPFLQKRGITFPVALATRSMLERFAVSSPRVVALRDGELIWHGHLGRVTAEMLDSWLKP